jgi:pyruvate,water dikinase
LSKRSGIGSENLKYVLPDEIESFEDFDEEELKLRREGSAFLYSYNEREILVGEDFKEFEKMLKKQEKSDDIKEITGMCASVGKCVGKVKVCLTIKDLKKLEEGDILVTAMTRPEFFQSMKTAAAFVTDEGGLTCHAAIVAREFNKPCIIATKNATKLLKDGDLVEVNADHGVVKVIKDEGD